MGDTPGSPATSIALGDVIYRLQFWGDAAYCSLHNKLRSGKKFLEPGWAGAFWNSFDIQISKRARVRAFRRQFASHSHLRSLIVAKLSHNDRSRR